MAVIHRLDEATINQIAAGEVIDRPASIVKELLENAIDAGADAVTLEIRDGGCSLIRVTDNGSGMEKEQVPIAFERHSTSKIQNAEDLGSIHTLGFRGEALSSIAAVAKVELITKTKDSLTGFRYCIWGGQEREREEVGCVDGTTFLVRDLFYNTPARKKFLKSEQREAAAVTDLAERLALSHPEVSIKLIVQGKECFYTSGSGKLKDAVYAVLGREASQSLLPVSYDGAVARVTGFVGTPDVSRGNRTMEFYFINGRYIKNSYVTDGLETAFKPHLMQHRYPFAVLMLDIPAELTDVNVHPSKMEIRFREPLEVRHSVLTAVSEALRKREHIPAVTLPKEETPEEKMIRELSALGGSERAEQRKVYLNGLSRRPAAPGAMAPLGNGRMPERTAQGAANPGSAYQSAINQGTPGQGRVEAAGQSGQAITATGAVSGQAETGFSTGSAAMAADVRNEAFGTRTETALGREAAVPGGYELPADKGLIAEPEKKYGEASPEPFEIKRREQMPPQAVAPEQQSFLTERQFQEKNRPLFRIIGQVFDTYWLIEFERKLFFIDQHAAHEKVIFERLMKAHREQSPLTQTISPPIVLSLTAPEKAAWSQFQERLASFGFETEDFGGKEIAVTGVPLTNFGIPARELLLSFLEDLCRGDGVTDNEQVADKIATMSCKAAIKGNNSLTMAEAEDLIGQMLQCENPYCCPHGRPTMIELTERELEKQFKRVL